VEQALKLKNKLVINTCGWVDGFGAVILRKLFDILPKST